MKITKIRLRQLEGKMNYHGAVVSAGGRCVQIGDNCYKIIDTFVEIETDEGINGISPGPIEGWDWIDTKIKPLLIGQDPFCIELLWDKMFRRPVSNIMAISSVDNALWDLKGKALGQPVHKLLGGPLQEKIPAYVTALGYSIEPEQVKKRVQQFLRDGYSAMKWFVINGPQDGPEGVRKNVALMKTLREAAGEDTEIMLDAMCRWNIPYTLKMADLMAEYRPFWFEEPVMPNLSESYSRLRALCPITITGGEHTYTRWGAKSLMDMEAMDIYQMDPVWAGGISEMTKICTLASTYDVQVIPHGDLVPVSAHVSFSQSSAITPMIEYQVVFQKIRQFFLKHPVKPVNGFIYPSTIPGLGLELEESKIDSERDIF